MDNFARLQSLRPPKFNSRISDVRRFFSKFDKYVKVVQPPWDNEVIITMLSNLLDDKSLDFFDSLDEEIREDYDLLKEHFIEHYDSPTPITYRWSDLIQRKQTVDETVTEFHDDLVQMGRMMNIELKIFCIFLLMGFSLKYNYILH